MSRKTIDLWVGIFAVLGIAAIFFLSLRVSTVQTSSGAPYTVYTWFDNIGGLKVRAPVKSSGVVVGRVAAIRLDTQKYRAEVTLAIDPAYPFPRDTVAAILTSGLLGEQYVGLNPGGEDDMLASGDTITMTQSAVVLENLISQFLYNSAANGNSNNSGGGDTSQP